MNEHTTLPLPIVRITLIGAKEVGKTRLIDSYVNAPPEALSGYKTEPTERCEIYHKLAVLPPDELTEKETRALVEIEDSPPSDLVSFRREQESAVEVSVKTPADDPRLQHPVVGLLDMGRAEAVDVPEGVSNIMPFSLFEYFREVKNGTIQARPLTQGRMGVMLVFSLRDASSLQEAVEVHNLLKLIQERYQPPLQPLCYLLGNKEDEVGNEENARQIQTEAENFSQRSSLKFFRVSAATGKQVELVFDMMAREILETPSLATFDLDLKDAEASSSEESE